MGSMHLHMRHRRTGLGGHPRRHDEQRQMLRLGGSGHCVENVLAPFPTGQQGAPC